MKTLFALWPWRTQASSSGINSDYPLLMNNGYETTCDKKEQLKQHEIQANWSDGNVQTIKVPLSTKSKIMPGLLRLNSTGEISSVNHHNEKNWVDVNKYPAKQRTLGSFFTPKMSLTQNFASSVYQHNFSMSLPGQVYNPKNPPLSFRSTDSWYTSDSSSQIHSLYKNKSFPTVKELSSKFDYMESKNSKSTGQMLGNSLLFSTLTSLADKVASKEDTSIADIPHLWKSYYLSQPATLLAPAACSDSTVNQQLCDLSSSVIPSSDTMTSSSLLVLSTAEPGSVDKSQEHQKSKLLLKSNKENASESSSKCSRSNKDDLLDLNNPSINIDSSSNINHCAFKHGVENDSPSVLNAPRKSVKKGRPSSKKQRKRQRQKQKHACQSSPKNETPSLIQNLSESCLDRSSSFDIVFSSDESLNVQVCQSKAPRASTPVKDLSRQSEKDPSVLFTLEPDSDESDIEFDGCELSGEENSKVDLPPKDDAVFNVTLSLDTIFKQKSIPSLKSILTTDEGRSDSESSTPLLSPTPEKAKNGLCFNFINVSFSEDDSTQEIYDICDSSFSSSPSEKCFFQLSSGLCLDSLFPSNSRSSNLVPCVSLDQPDCAELPCCSSFITEINAKWNLNYPSAGFRSCQSIFKDEIDDPSIKVHFAAEPHLLTVHVVGTEDRCGTWQLYALDRDRFDRRIQEAKAVISPVLEQQHRAKIMERNAQLEKNRDSKGLSN